MYKYVQDMHAAMCMEKPELAARREMCIDMRMDICIDTCIDTCIDMLFTELTSASPSGMGSSYVWTFV